MNTHYLYAHLTVDTQEVFYIGIGTHKTDTYKYKRAHTFSQRTKFWKNVAFKHGVTTSILEEYPNRELAVEAEKAAIAKHGRRDLATGTLVNLTSGGDGRADGFTRVISQETRTKQSASQKKRFETDQVWSKGISLPEETKRKISKALIGRKPTFLGKKHSEESKKKMSEATKGQIGYWKGKAMSEETKQKLSLAKKGSPGHWTGKQRPALFKKVINTETGTIYSSLKEAAEKEGINRNTLVAKLSGHKNNKTSLLYLTEYEKTKDALQSASF